MTFLMLGLAYITPWVIFTTAVPFYTDFKMYWLAKSFANATDVIDRLEEYRGFFINYLGLVVQVPDLAVGGSLVNLH